MFDKFMASFHNLSGKNDFQAVLYSLGRHFFLAEDRRSLLKIIKRQKEKNE